MLCTFTYVPSYLTAQLQGRMQNLMWVGSFQEKVDLFDGAGVQSTPSMRCMLKLGGSRGMPPRKILKNRYGTAQRQLNSRGYFTRVILSCCTHPLLHVHTYTHAKV